MDQPKSPAGAFGAPGYESAKLATDVLKDESTVEMVFPKNGVTLMLAGHVRVHFAEGRQPVPQSLVEHPYLVAHGVKPFDRAQSQSSKKDRIEQLQDELQKLLAESDAESSSEEDDTGSDGLTVAELREQLDELNVAYPARARKDELQKLLAEAKAIGQQQTT